MNNNPNQPREYDVVIGGQAPPPVDGIVLGGIEGVKRRLTSTVVEARIAALSEALNYGEAGLDLVIGALQDRSWQVQRKAGLLLRKSAELKAKQVLIEHDPWLFVTTFANWKYEDFNPQIGITEPIGTAYAVELKKVGYGKSFELNQFQALLQDPQSSKIEALICKIQYDYWNCRKQFQVFVDILVDAREQLPSLKALFIGDSGEHEYRKSKIDLCDISPLLEAYPNLELLQVRGRIDDDNLQIEPLKHSRLKTLIVETADLTDSHLAQICALKLPVLEYLELWLGRQLGDAKFTINTLLPILFADSFPNLIYLGLRSSEYSDPIAEALVESPIIGRLAVLDLSMGTLTDKGAEVLLNCPAINQLHTLNVTMNYLTPAMVEQLAQLDCQVEAEPQDYSEYGENNRYYALYE